MTIDPRPPQPHEVWDRFIDELDRQGQAGSAKDVIVPAIGLEAINGKRFGEITRVDVVNLSRIATSLGRRAYIKVCGIMERDQSHAKRRRRRREEA